MKMDAPTEIKPKAALSDYLAAERTLLAWIRTGLALMGFGFVVARFGLFLQQTASHAARPGRAVLRIIALVRHGADRTWSNDECLCRVASPAVGPGVGSR